MKLILLLSVTFFLAACKGTSEEVRMNAVLGSSIAGQRFPYDPDKNVLMAIEVLIQGKHPATFILDNGTAKDYKLVFNRQFVRDKLLKDTSYLAEIHFHKDSIITVSFGSIADTSFNNPINSLPQPANFKYDGIIGLGLLRKYLMEINYTEKYFVFHKEQKMDTTLFEKIQLSKQGVCPAIPVTFYKGPKSYSRNALLDLGYGKRGFLWEAKAANSFSPAKEDLFNFQKVGVSMVGGFTGSTAEMTFDSVSLFNDSRLHKIHAQFVQSGTGLLAGNQVFFGNDVLKNFGRVYFDFENDIIYVPK